MITKIIIFIIFSFTYLLFSQEDYICWDKTYGGEFDDGATSVVELTDGNYIVAGTYSYQLSEDYYVNFPHLYKLNPLGEVIWELPYIYDSPSGFLSVIQTNDGNIVTLKNTEMSYGKERKYYAEIIKFDLDGNLKWNKRYTHGLSVMANSLTETADNGLAICGECDLSDSLQVGIVMKFDQNGDSLWTTEVMKSSYNILNGITTDSENNLISAGYNNDSNGSDSWIVKISGSGEELFNIDSGDTAVADGFNSICYEKINDCYIATGLKVVKSKTDSDVLVKKFDCYGEIQWTKLYGYEPDSDEEPNCIASTSDGGFVVTGVTRKDFKVHMFIMKFDANGDSLWTRTYKHESSGNQASGNCIKQTADGGYIVCGADVWDADYDYDMWVLKLDPEGLVTSISDSENITESFELYQNYPNPFNPITQIKYDLAKSAKIRLSVYNISGQLVAELTNGIKQAGCHTVDFDGSKLNSGVYYYTLEVDGKAVTKKMALMK